MSDEERTGVGGKHPEGIRWSSPKRGACGDPDDVIGDTHLIQKYCIHNAILKWTPKEPGEFILEQSEGYFYCEKGDDDKQKYCHEGDWDVVRQKQRAPAVDSAGARLSG
ncbi:hypothetical protein FCH28_24370 [Streptomyces piniterrae]|uniref:Uncharacterized protein n=1 Tax=Streptomyces piniterrae TaxID=2571125 RepID=A0A4U0NHV7_9ACTN|nr:hypothetical protein [Streptomyces piniterrae]TJZ49454.1 hypothetical protein FCH28_24370 [Streptomyces piniterrae]